MDKNKALNCLFIYGLIISVLPHIRNVGKSITGKRIIGDTTVNLVDDKMQSLTGIIAETTVGLFNKNIEVRTDAIFKHLPESIQNVILAHEIGHHKIKEARPTFRRSLTIECAADAYAASIYGKAAVVKMLLLLLVLTLSPEVLGRLFSILVKPDPMKGLHLCTAE